MDSIGYERISWSFEPTVSAPGRVRMLLRSQLLDWGIDKERLMPIVLVAKELVGNAVEHAQTAFEVVVFFDGGVVGIKVRDYSITPPQRRPHDPLATRGRGLNMVARLAVQWSFVEHADGKTVWADVVPAALPEASAR
jgi:anti-sigma regulatory factor (Ser/Thr protein kinase)